MKRNRNSSRDKLGPNERSSAEEAGIQGSYLHLTEETNALDYLERATRFIRDIEQSRIAWKWVVIALHGALYGFAICALQGTNPDNVIRKTQKGEERLIDLNEALRRCQDGTWMHMTVNSKTLCLTANQKQAIHTLKSLLRNNFEHYIPKTWSIELHGMPGVGIAVLDVIHFLALNTGNYVHLTPNQRSKVQSLVSRSTRFLRRCRLYKEAVERANSR